MPVKKTRTPLWIPLVPVLVLSSSVALANIPKQPLFGRSSTTKATTTRTGSTAPRTGETQPAKGEPARSINNWSLTGDGVKGTTTPASGRTTRKATTTRTGSKATGNATHTEPKGGTATTHATSIRDWHPEAATEPTPKKPMKGNQGERQ